MNFVQWRGGGVNINICLLVYLHDKECLEEKNYAIRPMQKVGDNLVVKLIDAVHVASKMSSGKNLIRIEDSLLPFFCWIIKWHLKIEKKMLSHLYWLLIYYLCE